MLDSKENCASFKVLSRIMVVQISNVINHLIVALDQKCADVGYLP